MRLIAKHIDSYHKLISKRFVRRQLFFLIMCFVLYIFYNPIVNSQQLPLFSQYTFNAFLLNPAAAGVDGFSAINVTSRAQWLGVEGAPLTGALSFQSRILRQQNKNSDASAKRRYTPTSKIGLAGGLYYDRAGLIDQTTAFITYAYHIATKKYQFSLGATFSLLQFKVNTNFLSPTEQQSSSILNNKLVIYQPDANIGAYYTTENMYLGLSVMQLTQSSIYFKNYETEDFVIYRHYYLIGGYKYDINKKSKLEPSVYLKTSEEWRMQMDASIKYIYENRYWFGLTYRTSFAFIANAGIRVGNLNIGYAYDYSSRGVLNNSGGSHELMISYRLGNNYTHSKWLQHY